MTMGERLRKLRHQKGLSQHTLAERAGVQRPTISELESGKQQTVTVETAKRLARTLGCSIDYLAGMYEDDDQPTVAGVA